MDRIERRMQRVISLSVSFVLTFKIFPSASQWDEGPDVGGPHGPYRQSERTALYKEYVDKLVAAGVAFPCFCTEEELEEMKKDAEAKGIPPIYRGKWQTASQADVQAMLDQGHKPSYRFRVTPGQTITINDLVRGEVSWNTDTLGDFVILRSNGQPVYNFCVTIDDALMRITHVLRAEEHLPNTLRQILIYRALGFEPPLFGHMSIILAPDRSKLSKRHGATSVGEFKRLGYLNGAMINYLAMLGWNDGTEQELYTVDELKERFTIERITKSAAIFDRVKLDWMNGQVLRGLPEADMVALVGAALKDNGMTTVSEGAFVAFLINMSKKSLEKSTDAEKELRDILSFPLEETLGSEGCKEVVADNFKEIANEVLAAYDSGELGTAVEGGHEGFKKWLNAVGKKTGRKGKRLFMPARVALTGKMQGPEVGDQLALLAMEKGEVADRASIVGLAQRMERLRAAVAAM